jgi:triacylglycerol lipase
VELGPRIVHPQSVGTFTGNLKILFRLWILALVAATTACTPAPTRPLARTDIVPSGHRPVLIVPGWALLCANGHGEWDAWLRAFEQAGYAPNEVAVVDADRCAPNTQSADSLAHDVDEMLRRSGQRRVDVIAHSMGLLGVRWCIRFGGCAGKIANVVSLAGAGHGTIWASLCPLQFWSKACADLRADSAMNAALNAANETPDGIHWESWVSWCELVILPRQSALLAGSVQHDLTDRCVEHNQWKSDPETIATVVPRLAQPSA